MLTFICCGHVSFRWFKADAALGELVPCIYPLHHGVWCSSACSFQFAMSATADLNVLNKSSAKIAAFLVTVFKGRVSDYTFTQKGSGKVRQLTSSRHGLLAAKQNPIALAMFEARLRYASLQHRSLLTVVSGRFPRLSWIHTRTQCTSQLRYSSESI